MRGGGGGGRGGGGGLGGGLGGGGGRGHRRNLGRSRGGAGGGAGGGRARGGGRGGGAVVLLALALRGGSGRRGTSSSTVREGGGLRRLALLRCLRVGPRLVCLGRSRRASALRGSSLRAAARLGGVWRGERHWGCVGEDAGCPALLNELAQPTCSGCSGCGGLWRLEAALVVRGAAHRPRGPLGAQVPVREDREAMVRRPICMEAALGFACAGGGEQEQGQRQGQQPVARRWRGGGRGREGGDGEGCCRGGSNASEGDG